ncbi:serine hydrolase, partial [Archangium sp.]|uniref:serine hydrolase n=1 Tax=Archangium sp. TaxID=1872627 RepID=UPI002D55D2E8
LYLEADRSFHAASTMKVPVMIEFFRQVDAGKLSLDRQVTLANQFASISSPWWTRSASRRPCASWGPCR